MKRQNSLIFLLVILLFAVGCGKAGAGIDSADTGAKEGAAANGQADDSAADTALSEKKVITFAQYYVSPEIQEMVDAYNQSSDEYCMELITGDGMDHEGFYLRLQAQIAAGKGPDILMVANDVRFIEYIEKGIVEDLKPYIQRDLAEEDYVESSLYAYAWDDGIYAVESEFTLAMLVGSKEIVGDKESVSIAEMDAFMVEHPKLQAFNEWCEPEGVLRECMAAVSPTDYETIKQCILFAKKYGNGSVTGLPDREKAVVGENVLFELANLRGPLDLADYQEMYGDNLALLAYPGAEGVYHSSIGYSINAASEEKEGAWDFLRFLLSEEYQSSLAETDGLPVLKSLYEERLSGYLKPRTTEIVLTDTGEKATVVNPYHLPRTGQYIDVMTKEQTDTIRRMVEDSKVPAWDCDYGALNIIYEEAGAYFSGDKTIEEVMEVIRGRMEVYMAEKE